MSDVSREAIERLKEAEELERLGAMGTHAADLAALLALVEQQEKALRDARGFVSTGGPLYTKDRLELLDILAGGSDE